MLVDVYCGGRWIDHDLILSPVCNCCFKSCQLVNGFFGGFVFNRPDTQTYLEKVKRDEQERAKGQQGDNRSFFGKYVSEIMLLFSVVFGKYILASCCLLI